MNQDDDSDGVIGLREQLEERFEQVGETALDHLRAMVDKTRQVMACSECGLLVPSDDGESLRFLVSANSKDGLADILEDLRIPLGTSLAGFVFSTCQPISVSNPDDYYAGVDEKTGLETRYYLASPIIDGENVIGVLTCVNRPEGQEQRPFDGDEIIRSGAVASALGCGIRFYRRYRLNLELLKDDLRLQSSGGMNDFMSAMDDESGGDSSPLARAVNELEKLSPHTQALAASLIHALCDHEEQRGTMDFE